MRSRSKKSRSSKKSLSKSLKKSLTKSLNKLINRGKTPRSKSKKRSYRKRLTKVECNKLLREKISINLDEFKEGLYKSRQQAIAVSYSQVKKKHPSCGRYFSKKK